MIPHPSGSKKEAQQERTRKYGRGLAMVSVISADLVGLTGAGLAIGYGLWKKAGFPSWIMPLLAFIGLGLAFYQLSRLMKKGWDD